jgi:hypothetical protein
MASADSLLFAHVGCRTTKQRNARGEGLGVYAVDPHDTSWRQVQLVRPVSLRCERDDGLDCSIRNRPANWKTPANGAIHQDGKSGLHRLWKLSRGRLGHLIYHLIRVARIEGVSAFAQPARERPALIRFRRRDDVKVEPLIGVCFRHE